MTEYAEGTVAVATVRGVPGVRVFRTASSTEDSFSVWRHAEVKGNWSSHPGDVTDVRPLVVLDLDGYDAMKFTDILRAVLRGEGSGGFAGPWARSAAEVADQIEAQTKPKLQEPGVGGVVKAACVHGGTVKTWVRVGSVWYVADEPENPDDWDSLVDPVLVREGVDG